MPKAVGNLVLYSVKELSDSLGISELTIRSYLRSGKLKGRKLGVQWYVIEESLRDYFIMDQPPIKPVIDKKTRTRPPKGPQRAIVDRININHASDEPDHDHLKNLFIKSR